MDPIGFAPIYELEDDDGRFPVLEITVDGAELVMPLDEVGAFAQLRSADIAAYELLLEMRDAFLERGAPMDALTG